MHPAPECQAREGRLLTRRWLWCVMDEALAHGGQAMVCVLIAPILLTVTAAGPVPVAADPFRDALVASLHLFAEDGRLTHLRAILAKYPKLLDARRAQQL